jgi:hypothetical protein
MSDIPEKPRAAEVRSFTQSGYTFALEDQTSDPRRYALHIPLGLNLGRGMIRHIKVPEGWKRNIGERSRDLLDCRPSTGEDVTFGIDYTGMPVGKENGARYKKLIATAPHQLSHDDVAWLQKVFDANDPQKGRILEMSLS